MRIVSLLPSATEIICALGLSESLVGVSHDCDYPPDVRGRPVLSDAVVHNVMPSAAIGRGQRRSIAARACTTSTRAPARWHRT
jgi:iron complex transport system substrate-binding protein